MKLIIPDKDSCFIGEKGLLLAHSCNYNDQRRFNFSSFYFTFFINDTPVEFITSCVPPLRKTLSILTFLLMMVLILPDHCWKDTKPVVHHRFKPQTLDDANYAKVKNEFGSFQTKPLSLYHLRDVVLSFDMRRCSSLKASNTYIVDIHTSIIPTSSAVFPMVSKHIIRQDLF